MLNGLEKYMSFNINNKLVLTDNLQFPRSSLYSFSIKMILNI